MRPTQKGGSVVEESTLSTGLALQKEQNRMDRRTDEQTHGRTDVSVEIVV